MSLGPEHWPRIKDLFDRAQARAPELRATFLDETCAGNSHRRDATVTTITISW